MNTYILLFLTILSGIFIGKIKIKNFKLGSSGTLFSGLLIGWYTTSQFSNNPEIINSMNKDFKQFFLFSLILFISSVGLIASKDLKHIIKKYGFKFIIMAFVITLSGFLTTLILSSNNKYTFIGLFSGALTSSPGLATALETAPNFEKDIISGYSFGYIPGVLAVIFSMYLLPYILKININDEKKKLLGEINIKKEDAKNFDFLSYSLVIIIGILFGNINFNFGVISFKLGMTGGILLSSLILGTIGKIWIFNFKMNKMILKNLQEFGLLMFLSSVGLRSGYKTLSNLNIETLYLMLFSFIIASIAIIVGVIVGKYILKINWIILSGAICGGMTSTPGLGAAIDANDSEEVAVGYGATYPFALIGMVIFNKILIIIK
ncbi:YidE/YbjL duplication [Marinitoga sp. 1197]|uniref:aspartate-alanine antiporter-like transporter n=1 Tax=Marinitoga sp. 1197 TaxID=1428449 RepID=UPI000640C56A|nr:membrane protein [Marinitoga sp. 1197]KLO22968.1 YidE/YbjL duplication [Marinitoga sp. 1197]